MHEQSIWERQLGETPRQYSAFAVYRDQGPSRSLDKASRQHHAARKPAKRRPKLWGLWSVRNRWVERAEAYDRHLEAEARAAFEKERIDARRRHARALQAAQNVALLGARAVLGAMVDPSVLESVTMRARADVLAVAREATRGISLLPGLIVTERLTLGMSTAAVEVDDRQDLSLASRITADPEAVALAVRLLDRIGAPLAGETPSANSVAADRVSRT